MLAVTLTDAWARMPFAMLLLLAGLQSIPEHMYDAAKVDGATTTFQTFRAITVQYLRPYIAIVALINWMFAFRAFAVVFPMTAGGPGTSTTIFSIHIYREGMINFNYGYASAVAVFIIAITLVVATFYVTKIMGGMEDQWLCRRNVRTDQLREATGILGPRREPQGHPLRPGPGGPDRHRPHLLGSPHVAQDERGGVQPELLPARPDALVVLPGAHR